MFFILYHISLALLSLTYINGHNEPNDVKSLNFKMTFYNEPEQDGRRRNPAKDALRIRNDYSVNIQKSDSLRIRGGNVSDTKNYPYMAAIIINGRLWCAGAIVDENWVLTAAHCLNYVLHVSPMKTLGKYVKVRVGSSRPHEGGVLMDVAGAVRHPKFEEEPVPHADIALLKLTENLVFSAHINLIKIYEGMKEPYSQSFVVVTGWGATRGSDVAFRDHTPDLLTARLKVRTRHYCRDAYQLVNGFQFTADFFCASLRNGTRDACLADIGKGVFNVQNTLQIWTYTRGYERAGLKLQFDAGAPAVQQNKLMGVMSFGPERCGHEFQPAVFIKAFYFRDFVKHTISSYKSTSDLIEAIRDIDPSIVPPVHVKNLEIGPTHIDEVTEPDDRHD